MRVIPNIKAIVDAARIEYGITAKDFYGETRTRTVVQARIRCAKVCYSAGYTLPAIGIAMNKHHTTIMHYLKLTKKAKEVQWR